MLVFCSTPEISLYLAHIRTIMLSKNHAKIVKSLRQKKHRLEHRLFLAEGEKVVDELLASTISVKSIFTTSDEVAARHVGAVRISPREMEQISTMATPPGILAVAGFPDWYAGELPAPFPKNAQYLMALDGISDPGNMGTIIRSAAWFGFDAVLASTDCVDCLNPKVIQASMGALFRMPVITIDLARIEPLNELEMYGLDLHGEDLFAQQRGKGIYVIGSESHGLRPEVRQRCTSMLTIPGTGGAESLNAAISASIVMAEVLRSRGDTQ